jgi:hypothetical protein
VGIISDTLEDNKERVGQLLYPLVLSNFGAPEPAAQLLQCPICGDSSIDDSALQKHILSRHRYLQVYVRVNGMVLPDAAVIDQPITQLTAVLLGDVSGSIQIALDGRELLNRQISPGQPLSIEKQIPKSFTGKIEIRIRIGHVERRFNIYRGTQPNLNVEQLDQAVWNLQKPLSDGREPEWSNFERTELRGRSGSYLQRRYLEGFYSYILGCFWEMQGSPLAGKHLEEALGHLRPFSTMMAHTARCVLALKLNAFGLLKECGPESQFYESNRFFNNRKAEGHRREGHVKQAERGIWVDSFSEGLLAAIQHFNNGEFHCAERLVVELRTHPYFREPNNHDKLMLLQARTAAALNKPSAAKAAYLRLTHNNLFGAEAKSYCE